MFSLATVSRIDRTKSALFPAMGVSSSETLKSIGLRSAVIISVVFTGLYRRFVAEILTT